MADLKTGIKLVDECRGVDCVLMGILVVLVIMIAVGYFLGYQFMVKKQPQAVIINTAPSPTPQVAVASAPAAPAAPAAKECMSASPALPNPFAIDPTTAALVNLRRKDDPQSSAQAVGLYKRTGGREHMGNEKLAGLLY